ncbi:Cna B-type domain-containing protein, partial [Vagococcus fluvialis]|uniref:Cna B-type domain-containing protein n=1 Tax=Vagococcus fluvialis TaxID=2738 RepID=UPI003B221FE1
TVNLLADGQKVDTIELNEGNDWKHTFTDLPVVHDITDEEAIKYTVEEIDVDGYETSIAGSAALGFVITNTEDTPLTPIEPGTTSVDVSKEWIGEKQDSVTVNLLADGQKVDTIELNEGNDWKHTFTDLPVVHDITDEEAINYTVEEVTVDGYKTSIAGSAALGFVITNTEDPKPEDPKPEDPKPEDPKPEDPKPEDPKPEDPKDEKLPQTGEASNLFAPIGVILIIIGSWTFFTKRDIKE